MAKALFDFIDERLSSAMCDRTLRIRSSAFTHFP
jgi:hypothetical protein